MVDPKGQCPPAKVTRNGNRATFEMNCTRNGRTTTGTGESVFTSDSATIKVDMSLTDAKGHHTVQSETQMRWRCPELC
jgi:hypothetical protein